VEGRDIDLEESLLHMVKQIKTIKTKRKNSLRKTIKEKRF
jgi:hypothetical protein